MAKRKHRDEEDPTPAITTTTTTTATAITTTEVDANANFAAFGLDPRLLQGIAKQNFSYPTLVQAKAIPLALEGRDILGMLLALVDELIRMNADRGGCS